MKAWGLRKAERGMSVITHVDARARVLTLLKCRCFPPLDAPIKKNFLEMNYFSFFPKDFCLESIAESAGSSAEVR